jgi:NADH:ubiquinone oxidoreductase subunit K
MKTFIKSNFFWAKVLPTVFFSVIIAGFLYPLPSLTMKMGIVCVSLLSILLLNLYLKKWWVSYIIGVIVFSIAFYFMLAVISDYKKFPDGTSIQALKLIILGLAYCFLAMFMGILLCVPFKRKNNEINDLSVT